MNDLWEFFIPSQPEERISGVRQRIKIPQQTAAVLVAAERRKLASLPAALIKGLSKSLELCHGDVNDPRVE